MLFLLIRTERQSNLLGMVIPQRDRRLKYRGIAWLAWLHG